MIVWLLTLNLPKNVVPVTCNCQCWCFWGFQHLPGTPYNCWWWFGHSLDVMRLCHYPGNTYKIFSKCIRNCSGGFFVLIYKFIYVLGKWSIWYIFVMRSLSSMLVPPIFHMIQFWFAPAWLGAWSYFCFGLIYKGAFIPIKGTYNFKLFWSIKMLCRPCVTL